MRFGLALTLFIASLAWAEPPTCPQDDGSIALESRQLRAASLSLRGVIPTVDEYALLDDGALSESVIDEWLTSEAFTEQVVRHHRSLFWNNVENVDIIDNDSALRRVDDIYYVDDGPSQVFRGENDAHCGDFEATLDEDGLPVAIDMGDGTRQEGWVWVEPYWDPENPVKVCAYDAQVTELSPSGTDCRTKAYEDDAACGCGPNLQWCRVNGVERTIDQAFAVDMDRRVARILDADKSYLDLFEDSVGFVNGPMVHFYTHHTGKPDDIDFAPGQVDLDRLPDLTYTDEQFVEVDLGPAHSGVLTAPAWLMRFQTNRSRADRFYNSFLCQPFQPPDGGLTGLDEPNPSLDLTERAGCQYCHALLEPAAAYWGRWPEAGAGYLDPVSYPAFSEACVECASTGDGCSDACDDRYVVDPMAPEQYDYIGWLAAYEFLEDRHHDHVEQGPKQLMRSTVADGRFPACVAKRTAEWLMGREMTPGDQPWVDDLATTFIYSDYRYRELVKAVITSDNYRRVR